MPMDDLLHTVPKLISRIDSLELDLKQTKLTMGNAIVKLVKKVKKLEGFLKIFCFDYFHKSSFNVIPALFVSCDGLGGYDSGDQAEEGPNYALMAFLSSSSDSEFVNMPVVEDTVKLCLVKRGYRFTWVFFLDTKDETSNILKSFKTRIKNLVDHKVKVIRCNNGNEFKNSKVNQFCDMKGIRPDWLFDIDALTRTMIYEPIVAGTQSNGFAGTKASDNAGQARKEIEPVKDYILLLLWTADPNLQVMMERRLIKIQEKKVNVKIKRKKIKLTTLTMLILLVYYFNASGTNEVNVVGGNISIELPFDPKMPALEDDSIFDFSSNDEDDGAVADMNNLDTTIQVSPIPTTRIHKDHPLDQVIGDFQSATQTRKMEEPRRLFNGIKGHKWVLRNKKDDRGIVIRNKARLVAQGCTQEERIDYDEVFAPVARIEAIRLFLAYASFKDFVVYQIDVKSAFLYGKIEERGTQWKSKASAQGYQVNPKVLHLHAVNRIFRYLKGQTQNWAFGIQKVLFDLVAYTVKETDSDCIFHTEADMGLTSCIAMDIAGFLNTAEFLLLVILHTIRISKEKFTTAGLLTCLSPKTTAWNEFSSTMASAIICLATNQKLNFSKFIIESMIRNLDNLSSKFLMYPRVLYLEKTKTTQANEIASLKRRVKKLEKKNRSRTHKLKRLYKVGLTAKVESSRDEESLGEDASKQGRINAINADDDIILVRKNENVVEEVVDAAQVSTAATTVTITTEEITLAQALKALKTSKPKVKGIVFQEPGKSTTTTISSQQSQDKGKGIMIEKPVKPMKKKDLIRLDEEVALELQAEFDEEERLARERAEKEQEANIALIETWDDIYRQRLMLIINWLKDCKHKNKKSSKRAEEKRNKPPTKAQQRKIMCTYLKNMEGYKLNDLKLKDFDSIQEMFDRAFKRVNTFEDFRTELVEGKEKRAGTKLAQEITKKQKVEDDKEIAEIKKLMEIIPDEEEVTIDAIPLAVKSPSIVDWKIHKEGRKSYYQIIRADGKSQMYMIFSHMLKSFDREDLETLYKLVKAKYKSTRPVEDLDLVLWNDLKTMFEPHVEDRIYMLVEKKYPLTPSTLIMMLEKKLMIDYESKMAYQLLKFIVKQLKK
ncbi:putative ribonuclease H-like domain-containing protein [Tanacetum coccineum]